MTGGGRAGHSPAPASPGGQGRAGAMVVPMPDTQGGNDGDKKPAPPAPPETTQPRAPVLLPYEPVKITKKRDKGDDPREEER